jgi:hypothetical protein
MHLDSRRLEVHAKCRGQGVESAVVTLTDGAELPGSLMAVKIPKHQGALSTDRLEIEANQFVFPSEICETNVELIE